MSEELKPRRRWLRFSLRTLFLLLTACCIWIGWNVHQVRERATMRQYILAQGGTISSGPPIKPWKTLPVMWSILGVQPVSSMILPAGMFPEEDRRSIDPFFPEAEIYSGPQSGGGMF
jgi:hypothetical protein